MTADGFTPAQVWYVARVYPETVTDAEARGPYEQEITSEADRSYWEATANVLNRLADERLKAELRRAEAEIERLQAATEARYKLFKARLEDIEQLRVDLGAQQAEVERLRQIEQAARNVDAHRYDGYAALVSYLIRLHEALDAHDGQPALSQP